MTIPPNSYWDTRNQPAIERWLRLTGRPHMRRGASPYRGVAKAYSSTGRVWRAALRFNGRTYNGGSFETQEEAALAWNRLVMHVVGPGCEPRLNEIPPKG